MSKVLWGGATSSSQYEGGFDGEKGLDTQDCRPYLPRESQATTKTRLLTKDIINEAKDTHHTAYYPFRKGSDGFNHVEEDIELLAELGIDLYRFSISWSRLFPNGDELEPNPAGVAYYDKVFSLLQEKEMNVFLTMNHYAVPLNIVETYGGWKNKETIELYLRFASFVFKRWGQHVLYWLPFNEINAGYFSPYNGVGLVRESEETAYSFNEVFQSLHHQFVASAKTIQLGKQLGVSGTFGAMISCFCYYPFTPKPEDNLKKLQDEQVNQWFCLDVLSKGVYPYYMTPFFKEHHVNLDVTDEELSLLKENTCDFVSFSYYSSSISTTEEGHQTAGNLVVTTKNPYLEASEWGWQIDPVGLRTTLHQVYDRYNKPVIISENGFGAKDNLLPDGTIHDSYRIDYFQKHFSEILTAEAEGVDIEAYIAWGIIDIVSAGSCEMEKRYGVVYVEADNHGKGTYQRYKKDSFYWYKKFIESQKEG